MTKFFKTLILSVVTILSFSACSEDPEDSTGNIYGLVIDNITSDPLEGVVVKIVPGGTSTNTYADGSFEFVDLQPGSYTLQFSKSGYAQTSVSVDVIAGVNHPISVQMHKSTQVAEITINPSSLNFGTTQTQLNITITNNGNATAEWSLDLGENDAWLKASQVGGSIQAGRTQSVTFSVDRNFLASTTSVVINLHAFGNSYPISVSCAPANASSSMLIEPSSINFGTDLTSQTITIRNVGKQALTWNTTGNIDNAITVSPDKGTVAPGGNSVVVLSLDRSLIGESYISTVTFTDGVSESTVVVSANNSGGNIPGGDDNNPGGSLVVTNGLTAYYKFNDSFDDLNGIYDGFGINDPTFVTGVSGQAVKFSKANESACCIPYGLINSKAFTISFWAKDLADGLIFYSKCTDNSNRFVLSMDNGNLKFICSVSANKYDYDNHRFTHTKINDGQWHHYTITSDYGSTTYNTWTSILYIDGKKVSTLTEKLTSNLGESDYPNEFVIGGVCDNYTHKLTCSNFSMDNLRIYDTRVLTAQEIKEIFNAQQ
ncbi:MAG: carboxypeptidase regulatory-like domain-containing protein [Muribaculum sp.]|nr:carboxypeptidase regulatory-like domain-containing protein [Muribaculum sp.]